MDGLAADSMVSGQAKNAGSMDLVSLMNHLRVAWSDWPGGASEDDVEAEASVVVRASGVVLMTPDLRVLTRHHAFEELANLAGRPIDITLEDDVCLGLSFVLPSGPLPELRQIVDQEISHRSPFDRDDTYRFWRAIELPGGGWTVHAGVVLRASLDPLVDAIRAHHLPVTAVRSRKSGDVVLLRNRPSFEPEGTRPGRRIWSGIPARLRAVTLAVAVLLVSGLSLLVVQSLEAARLSAKADQARARLSDQTAATTEWQALVAERSLGLLRMQLVGELAAQLPRDTWLDQITIEEGTVNLIGYGPSAATVTEILSAMPILTNIRYGSPVTRDNSQDLERFRIVAEIDGQSVD